MIVAETTSKIDIYSINQIIDILLYSWILLIMVKRTICNQFNPPITIRNIWLHKHYLSDLVLGIGSMLAVCQFSNQLYAHIIHNNDHPNMLTRTVPWMIFHKLLTISLLVKYKNSQPRVFYIIKEEIQSIINKFKK